MAFPSHRNVTETSTGAPARDYAAAYAAGTSQARADLAVRTVDAPIIDGRLPLLLTPDGSVVASPALLAHPLAPAEVSVQAPDSLVAYHERFGTPHTVLFVEDVPQPRLTLVIDYHAPTADDGTVGAYAWARHRAVYEPLLTPEWRTWTAMSGKRIDQVAFAQFLEDNLPDIASPAGADILQVARTLEVKKDVAFRSSVRLDNGEVQLRYEEDIQGSAAKGQLSIPDHLVLGLQPFKGAAKYAITARFRYRLDGAAVKLGIELDRPHKVLEQAVTETLADVMAKLADVPVFHGPAPRSASSEAIRLRG